jgi:RNA polymerase sigma factor (sigma-70 family)
MYDKTTSERKVQMAGGLSDHVYRQVHRVFNLGAVGMMSDGQLLDWFITERDESAEAAFEELMIRHGPMVFGVCRRVLQDPHDAEDSYQAVFLVLAKRARFIRRKNSVASWLFGVAHRVAARARGRAARRRAIDLRVAARTNEAYLPSEHADDWAILHHEVEGLPGRLRTPLVLCYLEGLTYGAAAQRLGVSEGTLRGRLAQARKRLHRRLSWRGIAMPSVLLKAGAPDVFPAPVPPALIHSTVRVARGLTSANTAVVLARGVLYSMLLNQLKIAGLLVLVVSVCLKAGLSWGVGPQPPDPKPPAAVATAPGRFVAKEPARRLVEVRGVVVDEAGRPVARAEVRADAFTDREAVGTTGEDGSFSIPIRRQRVDGTALLARSDGHDRSGVFQYGFNSTKAEAEKPARIVLKPVREVIVSVTDASKAQVPGAAVEAAGNLAVFADAMTGPDGSARLQVPADAKVEWIVALKSGRGFDYAEYGPIDPHGRVQGGTPAAEVPRSVALILDGARTGRIKAVDREGKPLAGVGFSPWLLRKEGRRSQVNFSSRIFAATTAGDGIVTFDWLPANDNDLIFWPLSEGYAHHRVILKEGENRLVGATMTRTESIRGRVVGPDGSPLAGIVVRADGTGQGMDHSQSVARTAADGSYEMNVNAREAYAVYVDDKDWAAPSRLDVVVREGKPIDGVDFKLTRGIVIHGTVTVGRENRPAANQFIRLDETGGRAPGDLHEKGDRFGREVGRQFGEMTDSAGHYSIRVGPGSYTIMGPPRTGDEKIAIKDQAEVVRDFRMPRPEKGTITGRVFLGGAEQTGVAGAKVEIIAANRLAVPFTVTADAIGRFHAERDLDPLVICAKSPDGKLGAIVEVGAEDPEIVIAVAPTATPTGVLFVEVGAEDSEIVIAVAPTATATGVLLDQKGEPAANQNLEWGRRVLLDEKQDISMTCFAPKVVTDAQGRFTLPELVVGQEYDISLQKDNVYHAAGAVRPEKAGRVELGTLRAGAYRDPRRQVEEMSSFEKNAPGAGKVAPPIEATTLDGKPLKLADFNGRFVLLDFWATWCGACIGEIPQLQAVHDAYGKDERFAILSVSVDEKIEEPKTFQKKRRLPWSQAFLGGGVHGSTAGTFGIRAIPAFVLVGPDGRIVARGMRGDDIKKEVAKALAKKP